jgi:hypothetical protein
MHPLAFAIWAVGGVLLTLIDIAATFVLIRVLVQRQLGGRWLLAFDAVGKPLVDGMFTALDQKVCRLWGRKLTDNAKPLVCIVVLFVARMALGFLVVALVK